MKARIVKESSYVISFNGSVNLFGKQLDFSLNLFDDESKSRYKILLDGIEIMECLTYFQAKNYCFENDLELYEEL